MSFIVDQGFDFKKIFLQDALYTPAENTRIDSILHRYPDPEVAMVKSHWNIAELAAIPLDQWVKVKKDYLIIGKMATLTMTDSFRSTDFIPPSHANGCVSACQYCFVSRRKASNNPMAVFVNTDDVIAAVDKHSLSLGPKSTPNQCDPVYWTYDIGNNNDVSLDLMVSDIPLELLEGIKNTKYAKASFATKTVNLEPLLRFDPKDRVRVRYSLMPEPISKVVDIRTSPIVERIHAINTLVDAGYEVHVNFSPVILYEGWQKDWAELFAQIDSILTDRAKAQLKCEIIMLTHSKDLHEKNLHWNPKGEQYLWQPDIQQTKDNKPDVICYKYGFKGRMVDILKRGIAKYIPYCEVRYAF